MSIAQSRLRQSSAGASTYPRAKAAGQRTAFLCHSHKDQLLALGLQEILRQGGVDLYIDWQDAEMPSQPSGETAQRLRIRIQQCDLFLFLATQNSMSSRWCPWELGHADGVKRNAQIVVVPTTDGTYEHGAEYMHLYRRIDVNYSGVLQVFNPGQTVYGTDLRSM
jgi:hypothetical protein